MKRFSALLLLVASCGGAYHRDDIIARYAILTTIAPENPMYRHVEWLAERRHATILHFTNLETERSEIAARIRDLDPTYVAVILKPDELDTNFQLAFLEMACGLDDDPFPDFTYGYLVAPDAAGLKQIMQTIQGAEAKVEKRLMNVTHLQLAAENSEMAEDQILWATRVRRAYVTIKEGDLEYLHRRAPEIEGADFLILSGDGAPEGIRGLPPDEVRRLHLDTSAVFSAADYTGVAGVSYDGTGELVRRRAVPPDRSFAQQLLNNGAAAVFAPLEKSRPGVQAFEWANAILTDEPIGWSMKHAYDLAILSRPGAPPPAFGRFVDGKKPPSGRDDPLFLGATRILYGDPFLHSFIRTTTAPVQLIDSPSETADADGAPLFNMRYKVVAADCAPYFTDPWTADQRIYLKIRCTPATRRATVQIKSCEADGKPVYSKIASQAIERWRGETFLHVLIHGKELAQKDLLISLTMKLR